LPKSGNKVVKKKILYISGSIGLGHISKDLAIAHELRVQNPAVEITWLAPHPADIVLQKKGENLHPDSVHFTNYSALAENAAKGNQLNLVKYVLLSRKGWLRNVKIFKNIIEKENFDLVVGNETYEIMIGLIFKLIKIKIPLLIIYDFLGLDSMAGSFLERIGIYILNWTWSQDHRVCSAKDRKVLFVGEPEDIPDKRLGFLLPNRRQYAKEYYHFIGYVILFDPEKYTDRIDIRKSLGYSQDPLIVCSIGGTSIGMRLLELCNQAYPIIKKKVPRLQMVLVTGPRLSPESFKVEPGVKVRGYVPDLYKHYAASDLAIVQGGFSSTLELTALRRPFLFFPIEGHSEQEFVAERLARYNAGVRMCYSKTTPAILAEQVIDNLDKPVSYKSILTNGAQRAAKVINQSF
jgi:UDP-N-acetylglucosamine:LPS N-acetylglucosamine transferase